MEKVVSIDIGINNLQTKNEIVIPKIGFIIQFIKSIFRCVSLFN